MKAFTDLEQSKKLLEILPFESADMYYDDIIDSVTGELFIPDDGSTIKIGKGLNDSITAWSLAALLGVLPEIQGGKPVISLYDNYITYPHMSGLHTKADNLVDACVAMIEKIHVLNLL